jgi:ComF family protein
MTAVTNYLEDLLHLLFPHNCSGCGIEVVNNEDLLCAHCLTQLPVTNFLSNPNNPVEKIFYGRLPVEHAGCAYYFNKDSLLQHLIIQLKYKGNRQAGIYLGRLLGSALARARRFDDVDLMIPLPLNEKKLFKRGYNQTSLLCKGITEAWNKPVMENAITRLLFTETQTHKDRVSRWQTMEGVFTATNASTLMNKHILLVDDVITTGGTLEACGSSILQIPGVKLSIATLAYTI